MVKYLRKKCGDLNELASNNDNGKDDDDDMMMMMMMMMMMLIVKINLSKSAQVKHQQGLTV